MTSDLFNRLSKLDGPDREIDAEIYIHFNIPSERAGRIDYDNGMVGWWPKDGPYVSAVTVPPYTSSVDAAIALADRVLPSEFIDIEVNHRRHMGVLSGRAEICSPEIDIEVRAATPAIALCIAILRAKEAHHGE